MSWLLRLRQRWYFFKVAWACRNGHLPYRRFDGTTTCSRCGKHMGWWSP